MLATTAIGAIWTSRSPDSLQGVMDRFGQARPKVLFAADSYRYNGKQHGCREKLAQLATAIQGLEQVVVIASTLITDHETIVNERSYAQLLIENSDASEIQFERFDFNHPLYIMYSSGTTGVPKCIVHGAGGTLIQHLKEHRLHRLASRRRLFLLHDLRLDDVELVGIGPCHRCDLGLV